MPEGAHVFVELRSACIVPRYGEGYKHAVIAEKLNLKPNTVRKTCTRIEKATGSTNLLDLLQHCSTCFRSGRPSKIESGSPEADRIRTMVKKKKYQLPKEVAQWVLQE
jgi:DNA-binding NarL/FixJ family response regulator